MSGPHDLSALSPVSADAGGRGTLEDGVALCLSGGGYRAGNGWRGPYLGGPIGLDPWSHAYQVNTVFLAVASDAAAGTGEGQRGGGWTSNVMVVSAGAVRTIRTPFGGAQVGPVGDDVVYIVQGGTR